MNWNKKLTSVTVCTERQEKGSPTTARAGKAELAKSWAPAPLYDELNDSKPR